jgi:Tetratricopeptide repeat
VVSSLSRFWFIIGMGIFCIFMMTLQLESTEVFGITNKIPSIIALLLFCVLSYYFHAIRSTCSFINRLLSFSALYLILLVTIAFFGRVEDPLLHISVNGFALAVLLTIIFILMVAHEIPVAFVNIITQGTRQSKSLQHFLVIIAFYLVNLLLAYGIKIGYINLNIWVIDFFLLFTVSAVLGVWGFRQREPQYESIFSANPVGTYFILGLCALSFATMGYFMYNANDTILLVFRDVIIYSHLGYGIIFLFYVISNFGSMLTKNLQVHKVLYKPTTMPYFTFRLMGLICTFAFLVFDTNWRVPFNQIFASYYNSYGDLYLTQGNIQTAELYYNKSVFFRNQNHHAHYALAGIQAANLEPQKEIDEWIAASESYPVEQTIVNLSDAYLRSRKISEALRAIEKANNNLYDHAALLNAKGLIYTQLNIPDSALQAFQEARQSGYVKDIAETNLLAASVRFKINYPADSLLLLLGSDKEGPKTNALALANLQNTPIEIDFTIGSDTSLSATKAAFICNYFINQREKVDTAFIHQAIELARRPVNDPFKEHILIASAQAYYAQGMVKSAFELTREVAYSRGSGKYFLLLGNWAFEQGNPEIAANYFAIAKEKQQPAALLSEALALTEANDFTTAPGTSHSTYEKMIAVLQATPSQIETRDDESKYLYCRYKIALEDSNQFQKIVNSIRNEELKARALVEYSKKWYALDEGEVAARFLNMLDGLTPSKESTLAEVYYMTCMLLADSKNWDELKTQISTVDLLKKYYRNELIYWQALLDEQDGKLDKVKESFNHLGKANMYFEEGVVASSQFFAKDTTIDRLKSYSMLVEGLLVKPNSVRLLKAYVKEAAIIGFDDEAEESLEKLKAILPRSSFNRYVKENPDFFDVE